MQHFIEWRVLFGRNDLLGGNLPERHPQARLLGREMSFLIFSLGPMADLMVIGQPRIGDNNLSASSSPLLG
jgi:hypothetical protein